MVKRLYKEQKIKDELFAPLYIYCFFGILIGARLGHCLFYEPDHFLTSGKGFVEMFLPIRFLANGGWKYVGYQGLASHGGTFGLIVALIAIATGTTACFIRLGNLMNSEIIGKITDVPWAFIFEKVDAVPRHPGQLYEAIAYAVLFFIMWTLHKRMPEKIGTGWYFGFCLTYIFFLHRVHQGDTRSLRGIAAHRYGSDTLHPVYHPRCVLHAKSPQMKTQLFHMR